jgi:peptide/nickel transport system permease protein
VTRYVIGRLGQGLLVLWAAYTVSFFVLYALPSDPASLMIAGRNSETGNVDPVQLVALRAKYGLDQPILEQYGRALWRALHLNFGDSYQTSSSATGDVLRALPNTLELGLAALVFAIVLGSIVAVAATFVPFPWLRQAISGLPPLGVSMPGFWIGLLLIQAFSFRLHVFPAFGDSGPRSLILPAIAMGIPTSAYIAQLLARSINRTLREPFVVIVQAKGAGSARLLFGHVLRNAVLPVLTMVGMLVGNLFAGATITETVFSRPGIGRLMVTSVNFEDIPVVQVLVVLAAAIFVASSLVVDLAYPLIDPRIKVAFRGPSVSLRRSRYAAG